MLHVYVDWQSPVVANNAFYGMQCLFNFIFYKIE